MLTNQLVRSICTGPVWLLQVLYEMLRHQSAAVKLSRSTVWVSRSLQQRLQLQSFTDMSF